MVVAAIDAGLMAISLSRQSGRHQHEKIDEMLGRKKTSLVSSADWPMKMRVGLETWPAPRVRRIEAMVIASKKWT